MTANNNLLNCLGIITARSGSKGVPGKNIRDLAGKPMISYAVEVGLKCKYISTVMVTTDGAEIATVAQKAGAEVPFLRPAHGTTT
jgi:CMP-N,N'-diacetyllegionaminic acid synthase